MRQIIFILSCISIFFSCKDTINTYTVKEENINEAVYASGELFPEEYHIVKSGTSERILKILVNEGDMVKAGDALVILGMPAESNQIEILNNQVFIARENTRENSALLTELQHKITLAKQRYEQDARNANRYKELLQDQAVSQKDAEQVAMLAETSLSDYKNLQQQYIAQKNDLANRLLEAEKQLIIARQSQQEKTLTSRISGKVYNLNFKEGEQTGTNEPILMVGSPDKYKLEILVDERDISKINVGQKIYFETDIYPEKQFEAIVTRINPTLQKESRCFRIDAKVLNNYKMYPQSNVEANIVVRENEKTILIPFEFIISEDSIMRKYQDNTTKKVKVSIGTKSDKWVEIKDGLSIGDIIVNSK